MLPESVADNETALTISRSHPEAILDVQMAADGPVFYIDPAQILPVCQALKDAGFERTSGITGVDWWPKEPRFEVIYLVHSYRLNKRARLAVRLREGEEIESVCSVWRGANWYERETFDLFGIQFRNHPNLERIMMPADWEGHPLRKDYPVHGGKYSYSDE